MYKMEDCFELDLGINLKIEVLISDKEMIFVTLPYLIKTI